MTSYSIRRRTANSSNGSTICDKFTRESAALEIERRMGGRHLARALVADLAQRRAPPLVRSDNSPKFIAKAVRKWIGQHGFQLVYVEPVSPWQNAYSEGLNGRPRDEPLIDVAFRQTERKGFGRGTAHLPLANAKPEPSRRPPSDSCSDPPFDWTGDKPTELIQDPARSTTYCQPRGRHFEPQCDPVCVEAIRVGHRLPLA